MARTSKLVPRTNKKGETYIVLVGANGEDMMTSEGLIGVEGAAHARRQAQRIQKAATKAVIVPEYE